MPRLPRSSVVNSWDKFALYGASYQSPSALAYKAMLAKYGYTQKRSPAGLYPARRTMKGRFYRPATSKAHRPLDPNLLASLLANLP